MRNNGLWTTSVLLCCFFCWGCGGISSPPAGSSSGVVTTPEPKYCDPAPSQGIELPDGRKSRIVPIDAAATDLTPEPAPTGLAGKWLVSIALMWPEISQLWTVEVTGEEGA